MMRTLLISMSLLCLPALHMERVLALDSSDVAHITVKFVEGLEIRFIEERISGGLSSQPELAAALQRKGLDNKVIADALASLTTLLHDPAVRRIEPLFSNDAQALQPEGQGTTNPDLRLYYSVALKDLSQSEIDRFVANLSALPIVEAAYQAPIPEDAGMGLPR